MPCECENVRLDFISPGKGFIMNENQRKSYKKRTGTLKLKRISGTKFKCNRNLKVTEAVELFKKLPKEEQQITFCFISFLQSLENNLPKATVERLYARISKVLDNM